MNKIVFIPDSFKGTLSSTQICDILKKEAQRTFPDIQTVSIPVADGGEGSTDCFLQALGGERIQVTVSGPFFQDMTASYGILPDKTAIIETAACAGLPLVKRKDPKATTTYGVGQMMLDAQRRGCRKIIVGLGGSCTNDAACGAAAAIGIRFLNAADEEFVPVGGTLQDIAKIDISNSQLKIPVTAMCDIDNPLYGQNGAAYIFAPQKGADPACVEELDKGLRHISEKILQNIGVDVSALPGGGAAGGAGAGMYAFMQAQLCSGIETVLDQVKFDNCISDADLVITGEGKLDSQSLRGKVISGVAKRAKQNQVPVIAIVGGYEEQIESIYEQGVTAVFSINRLPLPLEKSAPDSAKNLKLTAQNIFRLLQLKN